jgi:hypothetical protein
MTTTRRPPPDDPEAIRRGALSCLDGRIAFVLAAIFVYSVLRFAHVSPFLYFQF